MTDTKTDYDKRNAAIGLLRCCKAYAGFLLDNVTTATRFDDDVLGAIKDTKEALYNIITTLYGVRE